MLNKLSLPDEVDENKLRKLKYLISSYKIVSGDSSFGVIMWTAHYVL